MLTLYRIAYGFVLAMFLANALRTRDITTAPSCHPTGAKASPCDGSNLPAGALAVLQQHYGDWHIVTTNDLVADDKRLWEESRASACPGLVSGDFNGKGRISYAITLLRQSEGKLWQVLVLLSPEKTEYSVHVLSKPQPVARASVVERLPRGRYSSTQGDVRIVSRLPVIQYEAIESGAIIYYWHNGRYCSLEVIS